MRRRDLLTGLGSAGVLAGAGAVAVYGLPSVDELTGEAESDDEEEPADPLELETVDAPGSEAGETLVPEPGRPTFVDLFATWCSPCIEQMPALAEAHDRIGDEVQFVSVTNEAVGEDRAITREELAAWWAEHDGNWTVALDPAAELSARYLQSGYPTAVTVDASGRVLWVDDGVKSADKLVAEIETAIDASEEAADG